MSLIQELQKQSTVACIAEAFFSPYFCHFHVHKHLLNYLKKFNFQGCNKKLLKLLRRTYIEYKLKNYLKETD